MLTATLLTAWLGTAARADAGAGTDGLAWTWDEGVTRRWLIETEVNLPNFMWFAADRVKEARVRSFQIALVIECQGVDPRRAATELSCAFTDVGLRAAAIEGDAGKDLLGPILEEMAHKTFSSTLQVIQRTDGRLGLVDLEDTDRGDINRKTMRMEENLRLILMRAIAGLDLRLPEGGASADGLWADFDATLMLAPSLAGSNAGAEIVHHIVDERSDGRTVIETAGRAQVTSVELGANTLATELRAVAVFDTVQGTLTERVWTVTGLPTAGSSMAEGYEGIPYVQNGRLRLLGPNETVDVGPSAEITLPGFDVPTLLRWQPLGSPYLP